MIRSGRRRRTGDRCGVLLAIGLALAAAGCGNDGTASVTILPTPRPSGPFVGGLVSMPNDGQLAGATRLWQSASRFTLLSPVYGAVGNPNVKPVERGILVSLSRLNPLDVADGVINDNPSNAPFFLGQDDTDDNGRYTILIPNGAVVGECQLMASVGSAGTLTRAFVLSEIADIDVASETVVRVVLDRLTKTPPVQLCTHFDTAGLQAITEAVLHAVSTVNGIDVFEINQVAFARARNNVLVRQTIDDVTGVPVEE